MALKSRSWFLLSATQILVLEFACGLTSQFVTKFSPFADQRERPWFSSHCKRLQHVEMVGIQLFSHFSLSLCWRNHGPSRSTGNRRHRRMPSSRTEKVRNLPYAFSHFVAPKPHQKQNFDDIDTSISVKITSPRRLLSITRWSWKNWWGGTKTDQLWSCGPWQMNQRPTKKWPRATLSKSLSWLHWIILGQSNLETREIGTFQIREERFRSTFFSGSAKSVTCFRIQCPKRKKQNKDQQ